MFDARNASRAGGLMSAGLVLKAVSAMALVGVVGLLMLAPFGASGKSQAACLPLAPGQAGDANTSVKLRQNQIAFARIIDDVAVKRGLPGQATLVALMTALQESQLQNLSYGDRDSVGLFQQRPAAGWGSVEQIMDPRYAAEAFFGGVNPPDPPGLVDINGWPSMSYNDAAQAVQVSGFPDAYGQHEEAAKNIAASAGINLNRPGDPYAGRAGAPPGGGDDAQALTDNSQCGQGLVSGQPINGVWPPEQQTIADPTGTGGLVTPRTAAWVALARKSLGALSMSCWDAHAWNPTSDHPRGKACDIMVGGNSRRSAPIKAEGDRIANWAVQTAAQTGVHYVIWYGKIWSAKRGTWIPYNGGGVYVPTDVTGGHFDHVHVSLY
ncbi:hypothetical protein [Kribbella sp. NPDC051718]|uniref:hypothetical protein n=1 Tax=Kribbella sp. NPDC051718 TaxID=3155168 RepID=UPI00343B273A